MLLKWYLGGCQFEFLIIIVEWLGRIEGREESAGIN